jgi:lysophospholipase L1-like esterase
MVNIGLQSPVVTVLDENSFASLERPEYFFDTLHLNAEGRKSFSAMLAQQVSDALSLP